MDLINQTLNFAALLLWLNWRTARFAPSLQRSGSRLLSTLKKTQPRQSAGWGYLLAVVAVLVIRTVFYWHMGSAMNWAPGLDLGAVTLRFRSDFPDRIALFSLLSFCLVLAGFYSWLLLLSVVNHHVKDADPWQRLVRLHLGWVEHWPRWLKLILPSLAAALFWLLAAPGFARSNLLPPLLSNPQHFQQSCLMAVGSVLIWKYLLVGLFVLHIANSYVYLGTDAFWTFVSQTARRFLAGLSWLPLRIGRIDLSPVAAIVLILALARFGGRALSELFVRLPLP